MVNFTVIAKKKSERNDSESFNQGEQEVVFTCLGCEFFLTLCLCLALPDAKVNNQSETTKCAMESGDGNTGE